ncbi:uncharacterized protein Z518_07161 [Rhinocladiella mackenziei CBS 650.93]|uniref:Rhinocladiella mackenziei CBS 650.93 unplaced genomic scaffold supercont1.5, whole genome shotgun sequence n=1 Tax=Rhinocladiella mackenziei CBS 650.93 TaxID=1442369 RepID=A0A0D2GZJ0_9EURO|nr:uncharacterized protein Z518_07161 [Rhinocladiella mackenziei CBS 650.93]KIX03608.1 hypothetical protein Z518_07161 [Rhinocladiella mackenziei CBS 650.93]
MATKKREGRSFTFVDYDINRRGVTETARAHLMKNRVRSKRDARSEWVSRNQFLPLRWMRPKEENPESGPNASNEQPDIPAKSGKVIRNVISHYSAVIDFQKDNVRFSPQPQRKRSRSISPGSVAREKFDIVANLEIRDSSSEGSPVNKSAGRSPEECPNRTNGPGSNVSPLPEGESPGLNAGTLEIDRQPSQSDSTRRRVSLRTDSEFGLSLGLKIGNSLPAQPAMWQNQGFESDEPHPHNLRAGLENPVARITISLVPPDYNLIRYFTANAVTMLGFDRYPEIVQTYDPVLTLFVPFALSSQWCFETMVLLLSVYYHQRNSSSTEDDGVPAERNQYLASRQNGILATTRSRISALANQKDSSDEDVDTWHQALWIALQDNCVVVRVNAGRD